MFLTTRGLAATAAAMLLAIGLWSMLPPDGASPVLADAPDPAPDTLIDDGRIGKVVDAQGIVGVRPVMHKRFSPATRGMLLKPGDWLRTDARGANAAKIRLVKQTDVTLGPATLIELPSPKKVKLISGELKIAAAKDAPIELLGPDGEKTTVAGEQIVRLDGRKLVKVDAPPLWLRGFEGATANESIGSLVVHVDGRDVPLTVGYHKVAVDVRDQIARTVIEESFVNHTGAQLEGVFYFPLPQDASISGFGMWIGDELVEADVVEKQRAREIYETILRERRDPGLLEWSGGNLFKARVFPIFAHSEKRVKITYTQVLPLCGDRYRYSYALLSEMLKQHPLRELSIDVKISSAAPLAKVASPTHPVRIDATEHSAHVEFSAQQYAPDRDFEVVVETRGRSDAVLIPHRRGEDGYFMLQLAPPGAEGRWERDLLPDGEPLELLILADTSGSMDRVQRRQQAEFLAAVLATLAPDDRFNVATCDVDCRWAFPRPQAADAENVKAARRFVDDRTSLGWTDLDKAFTSAVAQCGPKTHVIYVGDGIVTTGDGDPAAFAKRLRLLCDGRAGGFHAVAVGNTFEPVVLKAIARLGGGSVRQIAGEKTPQAVAGELLGEIARPSIRDLKVEFRGLRTARVYPEELPNLPAGTQQILLGRYLPEGSDQSGEVAVAGTLDGRPVRFKTSVSLKDAEQGNSFIPRLWARMHLDALLEQGASPAVRDEIVALSEEYHIMTPYTSLLVLESDADRERFQVKRRFQMRDGEKFFAEGRDAADYQLLQQQMRRAGNWRIGLRREVLRELAAMGRDAEVFDDVAELYDTEGFTGGFGGMGGMGGFGGGMGGMGAMGGAMPSSGPAGYDLYSVDHERMERRSGISSSEAMDSGVDFDMEGKLLSDLSQEPWEEGAQEESGRGEFSETPDPGEPSYSEESDAVGGPGMESDEKRLYEMLAPAAGDELAMPRKGMGAFGGFAFAPPSTVTRAPATLAPSSRRVLGLKRLDYGGEADPWDRVQYSQWLEDLFPALPPPPEAEEPPKMRWPAEARALAESLLRTRQLAAIQGGLKIEREMDGFHQRPNVLSSRSETLSLVSPKAWTIRTAADHQETRIEWCDNRNRGIYSEAFALGRQRTSTCEDLASPPLELAGHVMTSLEWSYPECAVTLEPRGEGRTSLVLVSAANPSSETRVLIDTKRHVLLEIEHRNLGKVTSMEKFDEFVEVAGAWWATRIETFDAEGRRTSQTTQKFTPLSADDFERERQGQLAGLDRVQLLHEPLPKVVDAKHRAAAGKATFDDCVVLMVHFSRIQQWDRVMDYLAAAERLAEGKPGVRWVRSAVLDDARRREELKARIMDEARRLADPKAADAFFLAQYLQNQASRIFQANEMLALLDAIKPVYERQPAYREAMKQWTQQRINYLQQTGRDDEVLTLQRQLAEKYPHDYNAQTQYAQSLANRGDYPAAYTWLDRALAAKDADWLPHEKDTLRSTYAGFLRNQGRHPELVEYLAAWIKDSPETTSAYPEYLDALIRTDRTDEANRLVARWLKEGEVEGPLTPGASARLDAAVSQMLGSGYNMYADRPDERWLEPLADAVLFFGRHKSRNGDCPDFRRARRENGTVPLRLADRIMGDHRFQRTDECREVRRKIAQMLTAEVDTLPVDRVGVFVGWIWPDDPAIDRREWKRIAERLEKRWAGEKKDEEKDLLAEQIARILAGKVDAEEHLAFLRRQLAEGTAPSRATYAGQLFDALLAQPWTQDHEDEALALLTKLSDAEDAAERLFAQIRALYRLTDQMVAGRFAAGMKKVEHPEKLTRTELRAKRAEARKAAQQGLADRLARAARQRPDDLARWMLLEKMYLDVRADRDIPKVIEECWEALGAKPQALPDEPSLPERLDEIRRRRCLMTLADLAARTHHAPRDGSLTRSVRSDASLTRSVRSTIDRLLAYLDAGIAADPDAGLWKQLKCQVLVALDRPRELELALREWIAAGKDADNGWRVSLAYLLAEQGKIREAVALLEAVKAADELLPADYRALADWYLVVDRREEHQRAMVEVYKMMPEWRMSDWLSNRLQPWRQDDARLPSELDENVLWMFAALFEKSKSPRDYLGQLQNFYEATRDFRLLACLADGVIGHTAGEVYPFLEGMRDTLEEVRDEATADSIVEQFGKVRAGAKTDVDRRALDLLEALVERRAAEVLNQPGPHVGRALAAMQRAFKLQWSPGEPRLMADLLASLGQISQKPLADEQIRELDSLHRESKRGSLDRLHVAHALARAHWSYDRCAEAIDLLEAALAEQRTADGVLPVEANDAIGTLIGYLEECRHYARGESLLLDLAKRPANAQQGYWFNERLYELYDHAIEHDGHVGLGKGADLYRTVERKLRGELATDDQDHRQRLIVRLMEIYRTADARLPGVDDDLSAFAFRQLPGVLKRQTSGYQSLVGSVANMLHGLVGPRDALRFLLERIESEPAWFRWSNQDGWGQFGGNIAAWRSDIENLGDIEAPLLKLVTDALRRDLQTRQSRNRNIYHDDYSYFWAEKAGDFARVAEEVYAERKRSGESVKYIAEYLFHGLDRHDRAVEMLLVAWREKLLDETGQSQLVDYLHRRGRYGESIAVLLPMIERYPGNVQYRTWLMHAYFRTKRPVELLALLKQTDDYFHQDGRWTEQVMAALAASCLENELFERSVAYYEELIPLHQRTQPNRGIGDGTLSTYYDQLARACAGLKNTAKAVDAACGAIVSWGPDQDNRRQALESLLAVLRSAPDLDGYVAALDKEGEKTGLHNPIVRKALGMVYSEKKQYAKAIAQLALACELQPNDTETHQALVACFDEQHDREGAVAQLLRSIELSRRDIKLYEDLGRRLDELKRPEETERAYTSIVEALQAESESHAMLAEICERQDRWDEAIDQWREVARLRALEPTGLLKLAAAQIHQKQWAAAAATLKQLDKGWPSRFGDVDEQVRQLRERIERPK